MAEQNLDFNIVANTQGMEEIARLINQVGKLETELKSVQRANSAVASSTDTVIRGGTRYNNVIDAQSRALRSARQGQQQLGMQINDFATSVSTGASVTQAFNQQIGQVGYAMSMMGGRLGAVGRFLAGPWSIAVIGASMVLGPLIEQLFEAATAADDAGKAFADAMERFNEGLPTASAIADVMSEGTEAIATASAARARALRQLEQMESSSIIGMPAQGLEARNNIIAGLRRTVAEESEIIRDTRQNLQQAISLERDRNSQTSRIEAEGQRLRDAARPERVRDIETAAERLEKLREALNLAAAPAEVLRDRLTALSDAIAAGTINANEFRLSVREALGVANDGDLLQTQVEALNRALSANIITFEEYSQRLLELAPAARHAREELRGLLEIPPFELPDISAGVAALVEENRDRIRGYTDDMKDSFDQVGASVSEAFKGMLTGAQGWREGLRGIINAVIDQLWKLYVVQQIVGFVTDSLGSIGLPFPGPDGRAVGGSVTANTPYLVGERGPELFMPRGNGTIIPNHNMGGGGGGSSITLHVDARGAGDPAAVRQQVQMGIAEAAPQLIAMAEASTMRTLGRPRLAGGMR
jgi:uncharacterized phage infection (PIP) family protein YhgE